MRPDVRSYTDRAASALKPDDTVLHLGKSWCVAAVTVWRETAWGSFVSTRIVCPRTGSVLNPSFGLDETVVVESL